MIDGQTDNFEGSYYHMVMRDDIVSKFRPLLVTGGYKLRDEDGKICITTPAMSWDTPWQHISHDVFFDCLSWHSIMFDLFSRTMPPDKVFVPSSCQQCWKVVVRPKTLLGLFALMHLQIRLDRPSKCGIEIRPTVHGIYGGYFYNHSLEEGLNCYELVRKETDNTPHLGPETAVILKRACTEFEHKCGDSSKWKVTDEQVYIETLVNKWFVKDNINRVQPQHIVASIHRKWIEFAYSNGDGTYLNFTGGKPLFKPYTTYHHLATANKKTKQRAFEKFKRQYPFGYNL